MIAESADTAGASQVLRPTVVLGCLALVLVSVIAVVLLGPVAQEAAHRRELGRGVQTVAELLFPKNDLFDDLATIEVDLSVAPLVAERQITLRYAGPYAVQLRTGSEPPSPFPASVTPPTIRVWMTPAGGRTSHAAIETLTSPFWGRTHGFVVHRFDAPGPLPLDQPIKIRVAIEQPSEEFTKLCGSKVVVAIARSSSE